MQKRTLSQMYGNKIASGGTVKKRTLSEMYGSKTGGLNVSAKPVGTQTVKKEEPKDTWGAFGGALFVGEKLLTGLVSSFEGAVDYLGSGFAKLIGNDKWAEEIISEDWFGDWYSHPEEWFNPSDGWKIAGDVAGGIGTSIPALGIGIVTHGAALPTFAAAALPAAGRSTQEAYKKTGELGIQEFGYGLASGTVEGGLETVTNLIGMGTGTLIKSFSKSFAKEAGEAAVKEGLIKTVGKSFIGEAFEEGASEFLDPYIKRATYDGQAENATPDQIIYSGIIGGLSGAVMGGGGYGINTANSFIKGHKLTVKGGESEVFQTSDYILGKAQKDALDADIFKEIKETREKLTLSLESTGGKVETVAQKKMLGDLSRSNIVGAMNMGVARRALNIVNNAPDIAKRLSAYGYKDTSGRAMTFTAEEITAGYDPKKPSSIYKALKENAQLRSLAVADAAGQLFLDTSKFTHATLTAQVVASKVDFDRFSRTASPKEIKAVSDALQIDSWQGLTYDKFVEKLAAYIEGGGVNRAIKTNELKASFKTAEPSQAFSDIPKGVFFNNDGVRRYTDRNIDIGISKEGDSYRIYDYHTDSLTNEMSKSDVNGILRSYNGEKLKVFEAARAQKAAIEQMQKQAAEIDTYARDNIKDYKKLSSPAQSQIRRIIEDGRAKGVSDSDVLAYAKVAARSGIDIVFSKEGTKVKNKAGEDTYRPAVYEWQKNRITVNPESKKGAESILIHELDHAVRNYFSKDGQRMSKVFNRALAETDKTTQEKILKNSEEVAKPGQLEKVFKDEVNAYFAERMLTNRQTLERIVIAEPGIKERVLSFFKGASADYADVPKLSGSAKWYYKKFKKMFDDFSARNSEALANEKSLTNINQGNMSVSDRQYAFAGVNADTADKMKLATAEKMLKDGADGETVRRETGWFKGYDGKWRFEIDDSKLKVATNGKYSRNPMIKRYSELVEKVYFDFTASVEEQNELKELDQKLKDVSLEPEYLGDMIEHPQLFAAYPQLQGVKIAFIRGIDTDKASYHPGFNEIALSQNLRLQPEKLKKVLIHEIQHAIQEIEGLAGGSNVEMFNNTAEKTAFEQYYNTAGEIEARDVANRLKMSEEQRKNTRPDIDRTDVIFAKNGSESYVIKKDGKGREYWQIDSGKDIFKGLTTPEEYREAAFKFLISNRDNKITVKDTSGKEIIFIRLSAEEFTQSQESQTLFNTDPTMFSQKMRLIPSLEDILLHSNVNWPSPDHKNHRLFKQKGFENYRGRVRIDNVIFNTIVRVGKASFGEVFYDINLEVDSYLPHTSYSASDINESTSIDNSISENQKNVKDFDKKSLKNSSDKQFALPLDKDNFVANGEEFATPTLSTVGKERMTYKEKAFSKDWLFTKKTSAYIHAVDEMFGIQVYLEKVGGAKNAKASIQSVRSAPHQAQTMIGSVQYDIFKGNAKSAKKAGEGLNEIFRPIEKQGEKVTEQFNDYLLHQLNVDKYNANEKMKRLQEDAVESLHKVQEEIGAYEARKKEHEKRIFELGDTSVDRKLKEGNKKAIEQIDEKLTKLRADEGELLLQMPMHAESELKLVEDRITALMREEARIKQEIFEAGNDKDSMNKKRELREKSREIAEELERENEFADKLKETLRLYGYSLKPVFNLDGRTFTKEESAEYISKYDSLHPEFKATAEKVWKFSKNLNEMRVSSGLIARSFAQKMAAMYPHYVPAFKSQINNSAKSDEGIAVSSTVKRAKGYNSNIMSVKESIASQVSQVARNGNINMLANKVYDTAVKTGDVKYVDIMLPEEDGAVRSEEGIDRPKPNTVSFFRDGKEYKMNVSDEIYLGFKGISEASAPHTNVFARAFNWITDKYKKLVTSWSPAFMIRNAIRDMQDAGLNSKHPLLFAKSISKAWVEIANNSENWQTYRAYGGFSSTVFDSKGVKGDVGIRGFELLGISERIASGDKLSAKDVKYIKGLMKGVENINAVVEQVPRFAEYLASIQSGETIEQAIYNSAEVTTNFARRGATIKQLNSTIIPFLNPAIQGFDKVFRNFTDAARAGSGEEVAKAFGVLLTKAISIGMLPALFNSLMYDDDEDYKDLREEDKENNYLFKLPNGTFLKLPRGRVASVIAGFSNRTLKSVKGEYADWGGYVGNVVSQVTPVENLTRTIFSPFMDVANNRTWYGTEIEGAQFDNVRPKDRYDESTSSIAIAIGQAINYSPKKIHYLIDQYSGVIGDFLLPATTKKAEKDFFSGNFTLDPVTSNKLSTEFYKIYDEAQYSKTDGSVKAQYQVKYLNKAKSAISEMYNEINAIQNSDLSNYQKLQQTRVLRIMINEAMKTAVRDFEEIGKAIDATENMGLDDSKTSDVNIRYAEITRKVYGSERALYEYNSTVYSNMSVLNTAGISFDTLYDYYFGTKNIESDKDREGKTIAGSKRAKVVKAIGELGVSAEERLLLICASGYTLKDGDIRGLSAEAAKRRLLKYILSLKGASAAEKAEIAEMCGFEVKNGKIVRSSVGNLPKLKI